MFISSAEKEEIFYRLKALENNIHNLVASLQNLNAQAPYGRCKDGTPRAKPGIKVGQKKQVKK